MTSDTSQEGRDKESKPWENNKKSTFEVLAISNGEWKRPIWLLKSFPAKARYSLQIEDLSDIQLIFEFSQKVNQ